MSPPIELLLLGGTVVDGSGGPARLADVAVAGGRVVAVEPPGAIGHEDTSGVQGPGRRIDAVGLVVAPGFVDLHAHSDLTLLSDGRARSAVAQGITTQVVGNCGISPAPAPRDRVDEVHRAIALIELDPSVRWSWDSMAGYRHALARNGTAINVAPLAGHLALRVAVAGSRGGTLSPDEVMRLEALADRALEEGAVGISTGLMYPPAMFADAAELDAMGRAVARRARVFAVHMRDYGDQLLPAVEEALGVARRTGCRLQVSHLAVAGRRNWGSVARALDLVDAARADGLDIGVDIYPYLAGSANLSQLLPRWAQEGGAAAITERLGDRDVRSRIRDGWRATLHLGWDEVRVSLVDDDLRAAVLGRTIEEAGDALGLAPDEAALELIRRTQDRVQMVAFGRSEADLLAVLRHEAAAIGSDGLALDPDGPTGVGRPHPRSYGCYPRLLGRVVREDGTLTLERAIAMSTSIPAARVGLRDRGQLAPGAAADIVVFDAATAADGNSFEEPARFPTGIRDVIVNGVPVIRDAIQVDDARPGAVLTAG